MENYSPKYSNNPTTVNHHHHHHPSPPSTPISRSDPNHPYPTTFVQADTNSFKKVVQMLTGSSQTIKQARSETPIKNPIPPIKTNPNKKPSKLYERRNTFKNFNISPLTPASVNPSAFVNESPRRPNTPEILSPGILNFPSLVISPVTPLVPDLFPVSLNVEAEDKAIAKKGFYLHPSPGRETEPRLLPLFPVTSPRVSGSS
ncbi:hypothetical protein QVD17_33445 [Tagetes erecta]|uniref:VQ domain-containing protein n=1 Tax=Tagetes erecta TaxID=13708 RepID=A0AAD8JYR7_TARER|nr:hypothetical protein QVD17_33445 [Tagetes erecta]